MLRQAPNKKQQRVKAKTSVAAKKTVKKAMKKSKRSMSGCPFHANLSSAEKQQASLPPGMTAEEVAIVKSCVPILEQGGEALTTHFYNNMIGEEDIVKPFFNKTHQIEGSQPRALAASVLAYAKNIDDIGAMLASEDGKKLINTIVKKHIALNIKGPHYDIVGKHLLRAIREVLGPEIATDQVIGSWGKAYGVLAQLLIGLEAEGYKQLENAPGGWAGEREFKIIAKTFANGENSAISYLVQSADEKPVIHPQGGQYLTLRLRDAKHSLDTTRNYSLSDTVANANTYRFTTQVQDKGVVTNYLREFKNIGDSLMLHPPTGEFVLREDTLKNDKPVTFIAAGSGITPFISMAKELRSQSPTRPLHLVHVSMNKEKHILAKDVDELANKHNVTVSHIYSDVTPTVEADMVTPTKFFKSFLKSKLIDESATSTPAENIYVVGPKGFMKGTHNTLLDLGVDAKKINYEFFGPSTAF